MPSNIYAMPGYLPYGFRLTFRKLLDVVSRRGIDAADAVQKYLPAGLAEAFGLDKHTGALVDRAGSSIWWCRRGTGDRAGSEKRKPVANVVVWDRRAFL